MRIFLESEVCGRNRTGIASSCDPFPCSWVTIPNIDLILGEYSFS